MQADHAQRCAGDLENLRGDCRVGSDRGNDMTDNNGWRGAINHALTNWLLPIEDHETPADALRRLIRLEIDAALDPAVSQSAADLVAKARRDALEEAARKAEIIIATEGPWSTIPAAIRALKGEGND